eukprot:2309160-Amphidinium_carterae.1
MSHLPCQIMDDWVKSVPKVLDESEKRASSDAIARQLAEFMADEEEQDEGKESKRLPEPQRLHIARITSSRWNSRCKPA